MPFDPWHLIHLLWLALGGIAVFLGKTQMKRLDRLEEDKAEKQEVHRVVDRLDRLEENMNAQHAETRGTLTQILLKLGDSR